MLTRIALDCKPILPRPILQSAGKVCRMHEKGCDHKVKRKKFRPWVLLAIPVLAALGYVGYAEVAYYRLEDCLPLDVENQQEQEAQTHQDYTLLSYNVGFLAYSADYSFFMDGGEESRARSAQAVEDNGAGVLETIQAQSPDFLFLQEVDVDATRSWHMDEAELLTGELTDYGRIFAQNYDSPYLFWPLMEPHGASRSGILTLSRYRVESALRRSLPVETGFSKFLDLDRCYSVSRVLVSNGRELCLYNVHLSAYTTDGSIATEQLAMLLEDMKGEYEAGNYVICGGDFNKDLLGDSGRIFGISGQEYTWAQPFPRDLVPTGLSLIAPLDNEQPVPSCRNADKAYDPETSFVLTVDGFLVSDNVKVTEAKVVDTGFAWSDHNPVRLTFQLT